MLPKVYLAGPITGLTYDEGQDWRTEAIDYFAAHGIHALSPLRNKEFLRTFGKLNDQYLNVNPLSDDSGIVTRDRNDVKTCDCVLMNLLGAQKVSIGTMIEVGWSDAYRKPLIVVMEKTGNINEHSMLRGIAGYRTESLNEGMALAASVLSVKL